MIISGDHVFCANVHKGDNLHAGVINEKNFSIAINAMGKECWRKARENNEEKINDFKTAP